MLCGREARYGKARFAARSTAPAFGGLYDADELFVQVPQGCRPPRQRSTPARSDRNKPLVRGPRKPHARRAEVDGKVTCAVGGLRREWSSRSPIGAAFSLHTVLIRRRSYTSYTAETASVR